MAARFRLETLLKVRKSREDERKRAVAARLRRIDGMIAQKTEIEAQERRQTEAMRAALSDTLADVDFLRWGRHWLARLQHRIRGVDAEIAAQRATLAQERAALAAARTETKILERLKERQFEVAAAEEAARERREMDDMNSSRFIQAALRESE